MIAHLKMTHITAGFVAILVGYSGSIAIVFQAATAAGATPSEIDSWLLVLGLGLGISSIGLSWWYRTPILTAWSTPGAALLVTSLSGFTMAESIGAFVVCGALILLTGVSGLFNKVTRLISPATAAALLAGLLLPFCLNAFVQIQSQPLVVGTMFLGFFLSLRFFPRYAVIVVLMIGFVVSNGLGLFQLSDVRLSLAKPVWVTPEFSLTSVVAIAVPLYFVTMSSQNMPGVAVLRASDYQPPVSSAISWTGVTTVLLAPFGGFAFNLAAITAAICCSKEAGDDPDHRYLACMCAGVFYLVAALFGGTIVSLLMASPQELVLALAGIALIGVLSNSLASALAVESERQIAIVTFLVAASNITVLGIGSAFWAIVVAVALGFVFNSD